MRDSFMNGGRKTNGMVRIFAIRSALQRGNGPLSGFAPGLSDPSERFTTVQFEAWLSGQEPVPAPGRQ
jgi:hypothetical protein